MAAPGSPASQVRLVPIPAPASPAASPGTPRKGIADDPHRRAKMVSIRSAAAKQKVVLHDVDKGLPCLECDACPGFEVHFWRKVCVHCRCSRESHDVELRPDVHKRRWAKVGIALALAHTPHKPHKPQENIAEVPEDPEAHDSGVTPTAPATPAAPVADEKSAPAAAKVRSRGGSESVEAVTVDTPHARHHSDSANDDAPPSPVVLTVEEKKAARKQLAAKAHQDPEHDHHFEICVGVKPEHRAAFQKLAEERLKEFHLGTELGAPVSEQCGDCHRSFARGDHIVTAHAVETTFHKECFRCAVCKETLVTLGYYAHKGAVMCGRCHAEKYLPRCHGCQELIFDKEYTVAEKFKWHKEHFCCYDCDVNICDVRYTKGTHGNSCCLKCFNALHAQTCGTCSKLVEAGATAVKISGTAFHKTPDCFKCHVCAVSLEGQPCAVAAGTTRLCCATDFRKLQVKPCGKCQQDVSGKFIDALGVRFHVECFSCVICNVAFETSGEKGAFPVGDKLYCYHHALELKLQASKQVSTPALQGSPRTTAKKIVML